MASNQDAGMDKISANNMNATNTTQGSEDDGDTGLQLNQHSHIMGITGGLVDSAGRPLLGGSHQVGGVGSGAMRIPGATDEEDERLDVFDDDEGIVFALDEDSINKPVGSLPRHFTEDFDADEENEDHFDGNAPLRKKDLDNFPSYERVRRSGKDGAVVSIPGKQKSKLPSQALALPASLPVTITNSFWPPKEATDSLDDIELDENGSPPPAKTILPQREPRNLYENMQAYSRSIQPADDPERLFGERPRRRYKTGEPAEPLRGPPKLGTQESTTTEKADAHQPRIVVPASLTGH